jgi:hypothetical protein
LDFVINCYLLLDLCVQHTILVLISSCIALTFGEPPLPSPYGRILLKLPNMGSEDARKLVNQQLLDRVADIISRGGDGSEESQGQEGNTVVDSELFERIARIISQNDAQQLPVDDQTPGGSGEAGKSPGNPSSSYGPPSPFHSATYGRPPPQVRKLTGDGFVLGKPFAARRIASFNLDGDVGEDNGLAPPTNSYGGEAGSSYATASSSDSYISSLPSRNSVSRGFGNGQKIRFFGEPQFAESIAAFDIPESEVPQVKSGYN